MKNLLRLMMAAAVLFALAACSSPAGDDPGSATPQTEVSGNLEGAVTWSSNTYVTGPTYVTSGATLTISPGATVTFAAGASLVVEAGGSLSAVGNANAGGGIVFKNAASTAWDGISFMADSNSSSNDLRYCEVTGVGPGGYAITLNNGSRADIQNCVIHGNGAGGIDATYCGNGTDINGNRFYDNGSYGLAICDNASADDQNRFAAVGATVDLSDPDNRVLFYGDIINADRYLTITEVPYFFQIDSAVRTYASLYLGPGVKLYFNTGVGLQVEDGGFIVAEGDATNAVVFKGADDAAGWDGIVFEEATPSPDLNSTILSYCTVSGVHGRYALTLSTNTECKIQNCTIGGNADGGIDATYAAAKTVISNNTFGDNGDNDSPSLYDVIYNDNFNPVDNTAATGTTFTYINVDED